MPWEEKEKEKEKEKDGQRDDIFDTDIYRMSICDLRQYIQYLQEVHLEIFSKMMESNERVKTLRDAVAEQAKIIDLLQERLL